MRKTLYASCFYGKQHHLFTRPITLTELNQKPIESWGREFLEQQLLIKYGRKLEPQNISRPRARLV